MGESAGSTVRVPPSSLRLILYFGMCCAVTAHINKHCTSYDENLFKDARSGFSCSFSPGLGPYSECKISNFQTDLAEVESGIRSLCIYSDATVIPADAFSHLATLEFLVIHTESCKRVQSGAFSGLVNLRYLTLAFSSSNCSNVTLEAPVFAGLDQVMELSLIGVRLDNFPNSTFDDLVGLVDLTLIRPCVQDLGEVFCHLPNGISHLANLTVNNYGMTLITNRSCPSWLKPWPTSVLAGIQNLELTGECIKTIEADSLAVFQNLSSLSLDFCGVWLGTIWESGVGKVSNFVLFGNIIQKHSTSISELCHLVSNLNVKSLSLSYTVLDSLTMDDLRTCGTDLKELSIYFSKVQRLDFAFWRSVEGMQVVHMGGMALNSAPFCDAANGTVWNLTILGLYYNQLTVVKTHQFVCTPMLDQLFLDHNQIQTLEPEAFSGLHSLKVLKLNSNRIKMLAANDFVSLRFLEVLLLDDNIIYKFEQGTFRNQEALRELALGRLVYMYDLHLNLLFYGFPKDLQRLSIDAGVGTNIHFGNGRPNGTLIFELNGTMLSIRDRDSIFLKSVRELKLSGSTFYSKNDFFVPYFSNLESLEIKGNPEMFTMDYTQINQLIYLKRLKLVNLNFANRTNPGVIFHNLNHLQTLVLHNCRLGFLMKEMFRDLHSLELFRLFSDSPLILHDGIFDANLQPFLSVVVLDQANFHCDCENGWFLEWAQNTRAQVINMQRQQCVWHYQKLNFLNTMEKLCQTDVQYLCYLGTAVCISLLLSMAVSYRFAYWPCVVLFFRLRGYLERKFGKGRWRRRPRLRQEEEELIPEENMKYDAFVSFSSHDEAWVLEQMAPRLEEQGQPRLRLCLHHRDFEVGKGIMDNIGDCIYESRRTVCVLSRQYLRSDWCSFEMRVATYRLLEEEKHRLILIFLERISPFELSAFHRLAKLVKSRTYLDWPQDEAERTHFWERLRQNIADGETVINNS
ncbi:toll-like receptor 13 [Trichomycterus rosablanca]|uniref:toll-like receptor 13 n=1 Tax=Trichomycterus rosablanca TaxID=2290929 RepID=UPI002F350354